MDLGAQWVHGESGNIVFELASKHGLLDTFNLLDFNNHDFVTSNGELQPKDESTEALMVYFNILDESHEELEQETGSFGNYYIKK